MKPFKICFFRLHNSIGDVIISNFFVRELHKLTSQVNLTVVASEPTDLLYRDNPRVQKIITAPAMSYPVGTISKLKLNSNMLVELLKTLWKIRREHYDLLITDFVWCPTWRNKLFFALCGAKRTILPIGKDTGTRRTYSYGTVLNELGLQHIDYTYEMFLSPQSREEATTFLQNHHLKPGFIILNPTGGQPERVLSKPQIQDILRICRNHYPQSPVVLLDYKNQYADFSSQAVLCHFTNILTVAALIEQATSVITVDTSILHIADVFQKPILAFYASDSYSGNKNLRAYSSIQPSTIYLQSHDQVSDIPMEQIEHAFKCFIDALPKG